MNYKKQLKEMSELEQINIVGGSSKGKVTYWKNVYDVLLDLFGMKLKWFLKIIIPFIDTYRGISLKNL